MDSAVWQGLGAIAVAFLGLVGQLLRDRKDLKEAREQLAATERTQGPKEAWERTVEDIERYQRQRDAAEDALDELRAKYQGCLEEHDELIGKNRKLARQVEELRAENEALKRGKGRDVS